MREYEQLNPAQLVRSLDVKLSRLNKESNNKLNLLSIITLTDQCELLLLTLMHY